MLGDDDRERLERELTPEQLEAYDELRAKLKREITDQIAQGIGSVIEGVGLDLAKFDEGFRNAVATGKATADFDDSMRDGETPPEAQ